MRYTVGIDLFILWFACASVIAFTATKDVHKVEKTCENKECEETEGEEK